MASVYETVRDAILSKRIITGTYIGHYREMCPHVIGLNREGQEQALCYQFAGTSSSGLGPVGSWGNWRCVRLGNLLNVAVADGDWHTAPNHSRPQTCVADVDVEVRY